MTQSFNYKGALIIGPHFQAFTHQAPAEAQRIMTFLS